MVSYSVVDISSLNCIIFDLFVDFRTVSGDMDLLATKGFTQACPGAMKSSKLLKNTDIFVLTIVLFPMVRLDMVRNIRGVRSSLEDTFGRVIEL